MSVFVHAQDIKTVHAVGSGVRKWQNSVHVVVECPLIEIVSRENHMSKQVFVKILYWKLVKIFGTAITLNFFVAFL